MAKKYEYKYKTGRLGKPELEYIKNNMQTMSIAEIAKHLKRAEPMIEKNID